ncbi:hypothetical protein DVH24_003585 [Malus domestica]|uniref:Uncharacterized protein n=1 Tax=Malus domestica TaxID=3750 RepID=A0A498ILX8_MALDO|nr:hypothetical protein DVH24_003585 [Malus domestica]
MKGKSGRKKLVLKLDMKMMQLIGFALQNQQVALEVVRDHIGAFRGVVPMRVPSLISVLAIELYVMVGICNRYASFMPLIVELDSAIAMQM